MSNKILKDDFTTVTTLGEIAPHYVSSDFSLERSINLKMKKEERKDEREGRKGVLRKMANLSGIITHVRHSSFLVRTYSSSSA